MSSSNSIHFSIQSFVDRFVDPIDRLDCYSAEAKPGDCCNTRDNVKAAYKHKRWSSDTFQSQSQQWWTKVVGRTELYQTQTVEGTHGHIHSNTKSAIASANN